MARPPCDNTPLVLITPRITGHYLACITSITLIFNTYFSVIRVEYRGDTLKQLWWGILQWSTSFHLICLSRLFDNLYTTLGAWTLIIIFFRNVEIFAQKNSNNNFIFCKGEC
jgi:hypothetical protein